MANLRLAFMGTPEFAVPSLAALVAAGHRLRLVYCQPPRRSGRGQKLRPSPVQRFAEGRGIAVCTPASLKPPAEARDLAALGLDAVVVAAYGLILPPPILQAPRLGCLNVHASLLPRWRGAAPIQHAILAGDAATGISIMMMDQGLDTGPVLMRQSLPIAADATAGTLHDALAEIGARLVVTALDGLAAGHLAASPQAEAGMTYASRLGPEEARLDWSRPAAELERRVRAFAPRPGAWFAHGDARIRVLATACEAADGAPGQVLDAGLAVACGAGALRLTRLQRPGKAAMDAAEFLRGYALAPGTLLG